MLATSIDGLVLRVLRPADGDELFRLVQHNAAHLAAHGDYANLLASDPDTLGQELAEPGAANLRFGIALEEHLIGRIDLVAVEPPCCGLGYWLASAAQGKGYATAAVKAVSAFARRELKATDILAGVTHGNIRSAAVLERAGFTQVATYPRYARFHLSLDGPSRL